MLHHYTAGGSNRPLPACVCLLASWRAAAAGQTTARLRRCCSAACSSLVAQTKNKKETISMAFVI